MKRWGEALFEDILSTMLPYTGKMCHPNHENNESQRMNNNKYPLESYQRRNGGALKSGIVKAAEKKDGGMSSRAARGQQGCPEDKAPVQTGHPTAPRKEGGPEGGRKDRSGKRTPHPLQTEHTDPGTTRWRVLGLL